MESAISLSVLIFRADVCKNIQKQEFEVATSYKDKAPVLYIYGNLNEARQKELVEIVRTSNRYKDSKFCAPPVLLFYKPDGEKPVAAYLAD